MKKKSIIIGLTTLLLIGCHFDGTGLGSSTSGNDTIGTTIGDPPIDTSTSTIGTSSDSNTTTNLTSTNGNTTENITSTSSSSSTGTTSIGSSSSITDSTSTSGSSTSETSNISFCGDWNIDINEECDDGPEGSVSCDATCKNIICGDQIISGNEECDDGNQIDDDDCSNSCFLKRKVFLSSIIPNADIGGVKGADIHCQNEAITFGLKGVFKAWLSESLGDSPYYRFDSTKYQGWYVLAIDDNVKIAKGWDGLGSDSGILNPINYQLNGNVVKQSTTITNTDKNGLIFDVLNTCENFNSSSADIYSYHSAVDNFVSWSDNIKYACDKPARLFCFETK